MSAQPSLVLLSGLPGAGKTTFAVALAARLAAIHLESDAVRRELAPAPRYTRGESARVFAVIEERARQALAARRVAIVDATSLTRRDRARFMSLAAAMRVPFLAVRFVAPETLLRGRLSGPRPGLSQATVEVFEAMRRRPERIEGAHLVADSRYPFDALLTAVAALLGQSEA